MPKPYPKEFRDDVVRVAQNRESGVTLEQVAKDFAIHPMTLSNSLSQDAIDAGTKPGKTTADNAELREANKRIRLLEQENEVLREQLHICPKRTCREKDLPARDRARQRRHPRHGDVSGLEALPPGLLPLARSARHRCLARRGVSRQRDLRLACR